MTVCCLTGAVLAFDGDSLTGSSRRLVAAGAAFGFAVSVKTPAVLPALALLAVCAARSRRHATRYGTGALLGVAVPNLPFITAAPSGWFRDVVMTQLTRIPAALPAPLTARAGALFGTGRLGVLAIVVLL